VANQQRDIIYKLRRRILDSKDVKAEVMEKLKHQIEKTILFASQSEEMDSDILAVGMAEMIPFDDASLKRIKSEIEKHDDKQEFMEKILNDVAEKREKDLGSTVMREVEKYAYLGSIDHLWMDHIDHIDDLREGVTLRAYGQRDPLVEFKNEAYNLFESLVNKIDEELSHRIFRIGVAQPQPEIPLSLARENIDKSDTTGLSGNAEVTAKSGAKAFDKSSMGRNDPCWCKSGKKWKKCHYPKLP
jgi:preprotein translocase subunit SecA